MSQDARYDDEHSTLRRARILGLSYIDTSQIIGKTLYKDILTKDELYHLKIVPIQADSHNITFGVTNTTSQTTMSSLRQRFLDQRINFALISDSGFREYMRLYDPPKKVEYQDIELTNAGKDDLILRVSAMLEKVRADDMLAYLVHQAHKLQASDIHTENQRDYVRVRFRIDGVLHPIAKISPEKYRILVSAIASSANVSTQAPDAQQGHIAQRVRMADGAEVDVNLRVETVPAIHGMDIVMRLFNMSQEMYNLNKLGLDENERKIVDDIISKPSGLVLTVGPTGSGKTTTLYSMLNSLNDESRKIITIEDPVEYQFEGLTQISVTSQGTQDVSFAEKLRAVLRLDPDIVMVGEIRDMDTAKTALQASLTGHLVLSTFHAGSAAAALTRLMDVIGANPLFASAIRLVMAQRLVRKLDDTTKQAYDPTPEELAYIEKVINTLPSTIQKPNLDGIKLYKAGKSAENPYGYRGQLALREQFLMSGEILKLMQGGNMATTTDEIEQAAVASGMKNMRHDAILKVCAGQTTLDEVIRVLG
jgi:type II secretory ATPase GspE/PulE/Tfp pilus assembly ATPase PilB-like protein